MRKLFIAFLLSSLAWTVSAQTAPIPTGQGAQDTTSRPVVIDFAEVFEYLVEDTVTIQRLTGEVELRQDSMFIYCDQAEIKNDNFVMAQGNVVILQNDTISTFADSLEYFADEEMAYLYGNVVLVNGEQKLFTDSMRYDVANKIAYYNTRAILTNGDAQLSSLRGSYDVNAHYANMKDSVFVVREDFNLIADTLSFDTEQRIAYFEGPTVMATPESRVYCEDGFYRLSDTTGQFRQNAQVARGTQRAMADTIFYYGKDDRFVLAGDARFADGTQRAEGDRIEYLEKLNLTTLIGDATFVDGEQRVTGERITYNGETQVFNSSGRIFISEPPFLLNADSLWYDEITGIAQVQGNVLWRDTLSMRTITAERLDYKAEGDYVKAYGGRPIFSTIVEGDSLWMSADTLLTFLQAPEIPVVPMKDTSTTEIPGMDSTALVSTTVDTSVREDLRPQPLSDTASTLMAADTSVSMELVDMDSVRVLLAYPDVRIYKSNLQAICDSLAYSGADSTFRMFEGPIMWSDTSQFLADTVSISLRNNAIDRVKLQSKSMIVNSPDDQFFNQVKGRQVDVDFKEGEVDKMYVRGNAESVYYILDEQMAYVGLNHVKSARMRLQFEDGELADIYFYDQPDGDLKPLKPRGEQPKLLEDFRWETSLRPASKLDLQ
ncbi:MAG: OstA-like protein [Saprospiraceae bacterium]